MSRMRHALSLCEIMRTLHALFLFFHLSSGALCIKQYFVNFLSEICIGLESQLDEVFNKKAIRAIFRVFQVCVRGGTQN